MYFCLLFLGQPIVQSHASMTFLNKAVIETLKTESESDDEF